MTVMKNPTYKNYKMPAYISATLRQQINIDDLKSDMAETILKMHKVHMCCD